MASQVPSTPPQRGRPMIPTRGFSPYRSWHSSAGREMSPHFSPDRITRGASPSRRTLKSQGEEIVPRITQPYRTSFSAVTAPRRVPKTPPGENKDFIQRFTPARTTMPGRIERPADQPSSSQKPTAKTTDNLSTTATAKSRDNLSSSTSADILATSSPKIYAKMLHTSSSKPHNLSAGESPIGGQPPAGARLNLTDSTMDTVDSVFSDSFDHATCDSGDMGYSRHQHGLSDKPLPSDTFESEPPETKLHIEKEYRHVIHAKLPETEEENKTKRNLFKNILKGKRKKGNKSGSELSGSAPNSPQLVDKSKHGRAGTSHEESSMDSPHGSSSRKSISNSITRLFKRMSPKSLRKTSKGSSHSEKGTPNSSCSDSFHCEVPIYSNGDLMSLESEPSGGSTPAQGTPGGSKGSNVSSPLPTVDSRMLKSIGETTYTDKSVYQAFKDKQSPRHQTEAASIKPQALRAVEFPDSLLDVHSPGGSNCGSSTVPTASIPQTQVSSADQGCNSPGHCEPPVDRALLRPDVTSSRRQDPPRTLNVRDVTKLNKGGHVGANLSPVSIGQCSLDIYTTGSEPSLGSSRNGHRSSTATSKRTLVSQDNITSPTNPGTDIPLTTANGVTGELHTGVEATEDSVTTQPSPKTPSYVKVSCSLSGIKPYNSYTVKDQSRVPLSQPEGGENGVVDSLDEVDRAAVHNGHGQSGLHGSTPISSKQKFFSSMEPKSSQLPNGDVFSSRIVNGHSDRIVSIQPAPQENTLTNGHGQVTHNGHKEGVLIESSSEENSPNTRTNSTTPTKDGKYFLAETDREELLLNTFCANAEIDLQENLTEEAEGKVRATIGKANLLTSKKFKQFRSLCHANMQPDQDESFQTTSQDLAGFWDMVMLQVNDVKRMFRQLDRLRQNGWLSTENTPIQQKKSIVPSSTGKGSAGKSRSSRTQETPKSARAQEAARARDEARRRLMAAKRAGRERKASQSDKDTVEIFVA